MAAKIIEIVESRTIRVSGENPSASLAFRVWDTYDEDEVDNLVFATVSPYFYGLIFSSATYTPEGGGVWKVMVEYGESRRLEQTGGGSTLPTGPGATEGGGTAPGTGTGEAGQGYEISFDISGESGHITQALAETVYDSGGVSAFTYNLAIGVTEDGVEGIDIETPIFSWTETHRIPASVLLSGYLATVKSLYNTTNNDTFRGFDIGSVRFRGANGSWRGTEPDVPVQFKFEQRDNETSIAIGPSITVTSKEGWRYLWVDYEQVKTAGANPQLIRKPRRAIVNKIFKDGNFANLGIGTT